MPHRPRLPLDVFGLGSDRTSYPRDVIEMALAHAIKDKSGAAYRRGDALDKRRRLMTEWARNCEAPQIQKIIA